MCGKLYIGFKGKNNASCILVNSISTDSYLLTNSFEGLKKDIEALSYLYNSIILFGIDKNLKDTVRIERVAEIDNKAVSSILNLSKISKQIEAVGIPNHVSDKPTHYLCNSAYWYLLQKYNGKAVLIHIPSIKNFNKHFTDNLIQAFRAL